eukprot:4960818-Amphidinium_carterae.1
MSKTSGCGYAMEGLITVATLIITIAIPKKRLQLCSAVASDASRGRFYALPRAAVYACDVWT